MGVALPSLPAPHPAFSTFFEKALLPTSERLTQLPDLEWGWEARPVGAAWTLSTSDCLRDELTA